MPSKSRHLRTPSCLNAFLVGRAFEVKRFRTPGWGGRFSLRRRPAADTIRLPIALKEPAVRNGFYYSVAFVSLLRVGPSLAQTGAALPAGIDRSEILNNPLVLVARLTFAPGAAEPVHTHPFSAVVIQLTAGEVEMSIGQDQSRAERSAGFAWFIAKDSPHAAANRGPAPFSFVTVALKSPSGVEEASPAASPAPAGIERFPLFENRETRVVRVVFNREAREPVHQHPFDLLVIQLTPGRVETTLGTEKTVADLPAGHVQWLPKNVPHAVANAGSSRFEAMSVAIR